MDQIPLPFLSPDQMAAWDALRAGSDQVIYCDPCDGMRIRDHVCRCWQCNALVKTAPNPKCWVCQLIVQYFFLPKEKEPG